MRSHPPCVAWAEKLALRSEDLSQADRDALASHVSTCEACAATQEDYHYLDARLRALPPPSMQPLPRLLNARADRMDRFEQATSIEDGPQPNRQSSKNSQEQVVRHDRINSRWIARRNIIVRPIKKIAPAFFVALLVFALFMLFASHYINTATGRPLGTTVDTFAGDTDFVDAVAWSPNGRYVASGSWDHSVRIWDTKAKKLVFSYTQSDIVDAVAWSPDGRYIASGGWDNTVEIWNIDTDRLVKLYKGHTDVVSALAWSPDGRYIASGSWDHSVRVWSVYSGALLYSVRFSDFVDAVAWSPNGQYLAVGGRDEMVHLLNANSGNEFFTFAGYTAVVNTVAWSPNSRFIASGCRDGEVKVWDAASGALLYSYQEHPAEVRSLAWSPNGQYIASGSWDHTVRVWNIKTGLPLVVYRGHQGNVDAVAWSPDGRYIASGSWDDTVQVWLAGPLP